MFLYIYICIYINIYTRIFRHISPVSLSPLCESTQQSHAFRVHDLDGVSVRSTCVHKDPCILRYEPKAFRAKCASWLMSTVCQLADTAPPSAVCTSKVHNTTLNTAQSHSADTAPRVLYEHIAAHCNTLQHTATPRVLHEHCAKCRISQVP